MISMVAVCERITAPYSGVYGRLSYRARKLCVGSLTYYENNRPRQYYPDFIIITSPVDGGRPVTWLAETKGEMRPNTMLKLQAAKAWCEKMSRTDYGEWRYLFIPQKSLEIALARGAKSIMDLSDRLARPSQVATELTEG
jgi:hypothetical protein